MSGRGVAALVSCVVLGGVPSTSTARRQALDGVVLRAVRGHYRQLHACFRPALARDRRKGGTLFVKVVLGRGDSVARAEVAHDKLKDQRVVACVLQAVRGWVLRGAARAGAGPGSALLVPLTFRAYPRQYAVAERDAAMTAHSRGEARLLLTRHNVGAQRASLVRLAAPRGATLPLQPRAADQVLFILRGRGVLSCGRKRLRLRANSAAWIPPGIRAKIAARGRGRLVLLQWFVPGGAEASYRPRRGKGKAKGKGRGPRRRPALMAGARRSPVVVHQRRGRRGTRVLLGPRILGHRRFSLGILELATGVRVPEASHLSAAHLLYVQRGRATLVLDGHQAAVRAGTAAYFPARRAHGIKGVKGPLVAIQLLAPGGTARLMTHR